MTYYFLILFFFLSSWSSFAETYPNPPGYAVASAHPLATKAGLLILAQGGNAFDAAIAVSAALAVVEPYHSGLGGSGFWLIYDAKTKTNHVIDAREIAPLAAHESMFLDAKKEVIPKLSLDGGLSAAIPGEPAALAYLATHYGRLPLSQSLAPAIHYAEAGFKADPQWVYFSHAHNRLHVLKKYPATAAIYLHKGQPYELNALIKQPDLAKTLRLFAEQGHKGFYEGTVAQQLVAGVREAGGIWSLEDLKSYRITLRAPLQGAYHNMLIITVPPPSIGGLIVVLSLAILEKYPLNSMAKAQWIHHIVEALRLSYWQASQVKVAKISSANNALLSMPMIEQLRKMIDPSHATDSSNLTAMPLVSPDANTTHISIIDADGNRVAATMTLNYLFGSGVVAKGTGVLLNDGMDDFSSKVGVPNIFGVVGNINNRIMPGKRPFSFMSPTFLEMPGRVAILGTPGGSRIPSMVVLSALLFYDFQGAISLVSSMRFHHQYLPDILQFEPDSFSPPIQEALKKMGYQLMPLDQYYGDMQAITWDKKKNLLTAASDPRHIGLAVSVVKGSDYFYGYNLPAKQ